MNCADASVRLVELLDNQLDEIEKGLVEEHLAGCTQCRVAYQRLRSAHAFLETEMPEAVSMISTPEMLALRIKHQLLHRSERWWQRPAGKRAWAAAAGVAVLLTASMTYSVFFSPPDNTVKPHPGTKISEATVNPQIHTAALGAGMVEETADVTDVQQQSEEQLAEEQWPEIRVRRAPVSAPKVQIPVLVKPVGYDRDM